jgi:hypothetical protein
VLEWQTVTTQSVRKAAASIGADRQAQSLVTSSQPDESARPIGMRQLKMQLGWLETAGRSVILYSATKLLTEVVMLIIMVIDALDGTVDGGDVVDEVASTNSESKKSTKSFIVANWYGAFMYVREGKSKGE